MSELKNGKNCKVNPHLKYQEVPQKKRLEKQNTLFALSAMFPLRV